MSDLLSVDNALSNILASIQFVPVEVISLNTALGRVLGRDIYAEINLPPFANSSMDGYAVRADDTVGAGQDTPVRLRVTLDIPAGTAPTQTVGQGDAARIMTGAPVPDGADAVIPVENTDAVWVLDNAVELPGSVQIYQSVPHKSNVRPIGEDIRAGECVLEQGTVLRPQEIGILAALGVKQVDVYRRSRVVILSSGNELVRVEEELSPGKIRDVNSYTLAGLVTQCGGIPICLPIARDTSEDVRKLFESALAENPDIIISSAGVSVGAADLIRNILGEFGEINFWRINLRPGKPLAFGHINSIPFFGLPGNPVSAMVTFDVLVRPALRKQGGYLDDDAVYIGAIVAEDIKSDGRRSYLRVKLHYEDNQLVATTTGTQSSGALMSMVLADGLLVIPEDVKFVEAGTILPVRVFRYPQKSSMLQK